MMEENAVKLSIVILTWNSAGFIEKCLGSIKQGFKKWPYEVIVVDNGSSDDSRDLVRRIIPTATLIENNCNKGVAPARNQGLTVAKGQYAMILDIDTYVFPGAIDEIIDYMDENEGVGVCAPKLVYQNGEIQESARRFPTILTKLLRRVRIKGLESNLEQELYNLEQVKEPIEIDYAIGACQVIRKKALNAVGLLDENIFYGPEDVDLCMRMWLNGWKVVYYPDSQVTHFEQRITKKKLISRITIKHLQGLIYYFIKHKYFINREKIYKRIYVSKV